jgi:hypothetical protein
VNNSLIELTTLFERISNNGKKYFTGRLGHAKVVVLPGDDTAEGQPTWKVFIAAASPASPAAQKTPRTSTADHLPRRTNVYALPNRAQCATELPSDPVDDLWVDPP